MHHGRQLFRLTNDSTDRKTSLYEAVKAAALRDRFE